MDFRNDLVSFTTTAAAYCAVVRYVHSKDSGNTHPTPVPCFNDQGANRRLFIPSFRTRSITMTMIRGTRFIVGNEAAQTRALENRYRSYLH